MRNQLQRLKRSTSTKSERRIAEILKTNHIRFKVHQRIGRYQIDFVIGRVALEVDGSVHRQIDMARDAFLVQQGYVPLHVRSEVVDKSAVAKELITLIRNNNA